jgi:DUF4097 and DUF4098 domain-containing protein YvlB
MSSIVIAALFTWCYSGSEGASQTADNEGKANSTYASSITVSTTSSPKKQNEFNWRGKVASGGLVEIVAISGDIRIEIVEEGEVEVVALKKGDEKEFDRVRIQVKESAGGIKVCSAYLAMEEQGKYECPELQGPNSIQFDGNRQLRLGYRNGETRTFQLADVRTELKVRIPREARLAARTHTGNVEAEWLTKVAPAQTTSSDLSATRALSSPIDLSSHIGDVRLTLSQTIGARVRLVTANGAIATDFPVTVQGGFRGKGLEGNLGQGGPKIALSTHLGDVELRQAR